ncbi:T9SS type A sorting domain-containing protein [Cellulophaga sp. BC115SP]|uniref:T9SS type A sorting domain-containing protein n=1 Tax=Cellulophaga sp. BC115SP TaxID=2683263 RepID=UPI001412C531|nr:T9SS type A sorting domain-containing protein [Cellulophaga sp. BC115SP]NBB27619.1 T9SS type A sorting domain-containing protein [Cellulophaga sp. BC115SP]
MTKNYFIAFFIGVITKAYPQSTSIQEVQSDYIKSSKATTVPTHYRASKAVVLQSGFKAKGKNSFSAKIQHFPLKESITSVSLAVSPNPVQDESFIHFKIPQSTLVSLTVSSASGEPIVQLIQQEYKEAGEYRLMLNSKEWASGMYLLHLQTSQGITIFKVIKP